MSDCLFCKIASGILPADIVYEDDEIFAFKDIQPKAPIHVLVIPKQHTATLSDVDDPALLGLLMLRVQYIADTVLKLDAGYRVVINVRKGGGQVVFHLHVHILGGKVLSF
ncbi:MAG: histidine triad nucleotide-binding protein [Mariprofundaceae bacterium]|nr:histidine triad nucleotide-binding protein [Mariprofundaceae bacterium]